MFGPQQDAQSYRIDESRLLQIASAAMDDTDGTIESPSTTSAADQKAIELQSASQSTGEELGYDRIVAKMHRVLASGIAKGKRLTAQKVSVSDGAPKRPQKLHKIETIY